MNKCNDCDLCKHRNNIVYGSGSKYADLMFIGEAPGEEEDKQGKPFVGAAGKVLDELLDSFMIRRKYVYICNVVCCRPPENRNPKDEEILACKKHLIKQIKEINPKIICTLGSVATKVFLKTDKPMKELHGKTYRGKRILFVSYHPAYAVYNPNNYDLLYDDFIKLSDLYHNYGVKKLRKG